MCMSSAGASEVARHAATVRWQEREGNPVDRRSAARLLQRDDLSDVTRMELEQIAEGEADGE
jgi:hypothetical protein